MLSLNLGARPLVKLPASAFPDRADIYVCDKCGRDITRHFRPGQAHVWAPMGPERCLCLCGERYLTGAKEWDHFSDWERNRRVGDTLGLGILFSAIVFNTGPPGLCCPALCFRSSGGSARNGFGHYCAPILFDADSVLARGICIDVAHQSRLSHSLRTELKNLASDFQPIRDVKPH
jgi:hypothetical protein